MSWAVVVPRLDPSVRQLCARAYPGHKRGCPNHGKRRSCPPAAPLLGEVLDLSREVHAVWNRFDLGAHVEAMRARHPAWSDRQLRCCLYWQPRARRELRARIKEFLEEKLREGVSLVLAACPEANGVDVTATMASVGVALEWPPIRFAHQVVLVGHPRL